MGACSEDEDKCNGSDMCKRRHIREPVAAASTTILTRPVTKLCFLEMDGVADKVGPV